MNIIRVFPRRTSLTPTDNMAFVGDPPMIRPDADEVHVSVTFTWDILKGTRLKKAWGQYYPVTHIGGPAFEDSETNPCNAEFVPGMYVREGVTFTSKGCNRKCPWCLVPPREGKLRLLRPFADGHIIQDNNFLQTRLGHQLDVFAMLQRQKRAAVFSGGIDARLVTDWTAKLFSQTRIHELFLAADTKGSLSSLGKAAELLGFLGRNKLRCYVLIAFDGETIEQAAKRLESVWDIGCLPFAQLYQPPDHFIRYPQEWKSLARTWSRPAAMVALHK